jgi:hypothetical protein
MAQEKADAGSVAAAVAAGAHRPTEDTPHCRCTHPLHPDRKKTHKGAMMERYSCPLRRWWNFWKHPRVWMPARQGHGGV